MSWHEPRTGGAPVEDHALGLECKDNQNTVLIRAPSNSQVFLKEHEGAEPETSVTS